MLHYIKMYNFGAIIGTIVFCFINLSPYVVLWGLANLISCVIIIMAELYKKELAECADSHYGFRPEDVKKLREALNKTDPLTIPVCSEGGPTMLEILKLLDANAPAPDHCEECRRFYNELRDEECNKK